MAGRDPEKVLIDPWGAILIEDYKRMIEEFGIEPFTDELLRRLPSPNRLMRRKVIFSHRDLGVIVEAMERKEPFYALSGITTSADKIHLGNKMVVENMAYFQRQGAKTFLLVADLEVAATKGISVEESRKRALDFHIPAYLALGMDPEKTVFYFQSQNKDVMRLAHILSRRVTLSEFRAIYGEINVGKITASLLDISDILYPQLEERIPGIIPVGVDQDPHLRLARDVAKRAKDVQRFMPPASVYHKFTPSLDGSFKMSKSKPGSYIEIPEDPDGAAKKIDKALTGGRETEELQRKLGGEPEKCVIFELYKQHLIEDDRELDRIYNDCRSGALLCGEDKAKAMRLVREFLTDFNRKMERAKDEVGDLVFLE
ncbi:MAG: tryptophan--tRNA ligase [Candidatus Bathyarchaeia archaeon]